jgi:hypothetical protein
MFSSIFFNFIVPTDIHFSNLFCYDESMKKLLNFNLIYYLTVILASLAVSGGLIYKIYALNWLGLIISLILAILISLFVIKKTAKPEIAAEKTRANFWQFSYWILYIISLLIIFGHRTDQAIVSPWELVPKLFFLIFFLLILNLIIICRQEQRINLVYISSFFLLIFSLAAIVYKIGYGFDPFIHEASLNYIDQHGFVLPKNFYYFGYYSLAMFAHKFLFIKIAFIIKTLVPVLAAILIPYSFYQLKEKNSQAILLLTLLPFSAFIISTPQSLAYIFVITSLIWLWAEPKNNKYLSGLLALAALVVHPLAGIPILLFLFLSSLTAKWPKKEKLAKSLIFAANAIITPIAFLFSSQNLKWIGWKNLSFNFNLSLFGQENFILNSSYFIYSITLILILAITVMGIKLNWKQKKAQNYLIIAGSLLVSYFLLSSFSFQSLVASEQGNYAQRLLILAAIFLLPSFYSGINHLLARINQEGKTIRILITIFITMAITISLYHSYPRLDNYHNSRGYSVGANDLDTVKLIENNSQTDYLVLANQQVSVAALKTFGFNRYYNQHYFYPIPTGGPLYQFYLDMVYKEPKKETMVSAMDLLGVNEAYFVLNNYWWNFPKLLAANQLEAVWWERLGDNYIFYYQR